MTITLFEFAPTRSARARWTLLELGVPFESIAGRETFQTRRSNGCIHCGGSWRCSVTDIFVGYALNWARLAGLTAQLPNVNSYCERLLSMPHCPYQSTF